MSRAEMLTLPRVIAQRLRTEAERHGFSIEEYLLELLSQSLDPKDRAIEYLEAAKELLEQAREELDKGDLRQAAEKLWGATALAIKAYAYWREGKRLSSHGELWEYKSIVAKELGRWVYNAWNAGQTMHTCFYEGWCRKDDIENAIEQIIQLIEEIDKKVRSGKQS